MTRIGRYEVEAEIGRGAMGVVYLARDPRLDRRVAVKTFLLPDGLGQAQKNMYLERFLREARSAATVPHPAIVTVYDVDWDADLGRPFLSMEYVPGDTLRQRLLTEGRLSLERVRALADALAGALGAAHEAGIVHRDVKPANILIRAGDGAVKIADFGIARCPSSDLTQSGSTLGSPAYMSPEQVRAGTVDARSDLFSLAVVLYEAFCGERPFGGDEPAALAYAIVHETPLPISRRVAGLPRGLDRFFERALAKDPAERFPDAGVLGRALVEAARDDPSPDPDATQVDEARAGDDDRRRPGPQPAPRAVAIEPHPVGPRSAPAYPVEGSGLDLPVPPAGDRYSPASRRWNWKRYVPLVLLLVVAGTAWLLRGGGEAYLQLDGRSSVEHGELQLRVDGEPVYVRELNGTPEPERRGPKFLNRLIPSKAESFEAWIEVPSGKHEVEASLLVAGDDRVHRASVVVDLEPGENRRLRLAAGASLKAPVTLKVH